MGANSVQETLALIKAAWGNNVANEVNKAFTQSGSATSGITEYDLEKPAKLLYPVTTVLRNMIPRSVGGRGIQANWRTITAINPGGVGIGVSEGNRSGYMSQTVNDVLAAFKFFGLENYVTFEADYAAQGFDDVKALAVKTLLEATMEQEERVLLGGNASVALGTCGSVTALASNTGGHLADATYSVICCPLTYDGMQWSSVANGVKLPYTRVNADGSTDTIQGFSGVKSSAAGSLTVNGGTGLGSIAASVTAIRGAFGYAWYLGTSGNEKLAAITGAPSTTLKYSATDAGGTQSDDVLPASDTSQNSLHYDGLLTQIVKSGSGAYVTDLAGAALTTSGSGTGGIAEIDTALTAFYTNYRLIPTKIIMSGIDQQNAKNKILTGNTNLAPFFMGMGGAGDVGGGAQFKKYNNPIGYGAQELDVLVHPFLPQGTMIFYSDTVPYPLSNVGQIQRVLLRRDYYQIDWPITTRRWTYGVYLDGVLQNYFLPAFGVITGIANA